MLQHDHAQKATADNTGGLNVAEEQLLLQYYASKIQALAQQLGFPRKVALTALIFFKRFYISRSVLDAEPVVFMLTSVYLACKAEESYIAAEDFCKSVQRSESVVLRNEMTLLQGLRFDLVVHHPLWSLQGLFADFDSWRREPNTTASAAISTLASAAVQQAHSAAQQALNALALTDALLLHPPGLLALAAMRVGFHQQGVDLGGFLQHAAAQSEDLSSPTATDATAEGQLLTLLAGVDMLQQQGMRQISDDEVREVDRKIKASKDPKPS